MNFEIAKTYFFEGLDNFQKGDYLAAENSFRESLNIIPDRVSTLSNLAATLIKLHKFVEARDLCINAISIDSNSAESWLNLGLIDKEQSDYSDAVTKFNKAIEISPDCAEAYTNLGVTLLKLGQLADARAKCHMALELKPDYVEAHINLGIVQQELGQLNDAVSSFHKALEITPDCAEAHNNLSNVLIELGQFVKAQACCRKALELKPDYRQACVNLGIVQLNVGQPNDAEVSFRRALEIQPDLTDVNSALLFILNFTDTHEPSYHLEQARQFGQIVAKKAARRFSVWQCATQPERLRVGLVSGDFWKHPVGYFLEGVLAQIDPARIELIAYPTHDVEDELTDRIRPHFKDWKPLVGKSDEEAARLIQADGVHILLDLAGHTEHNRLPVFAWKPAPVQASWLGYFATTGVAEMDYLLADKISVPEDQQEQFTESIWYLPDTRLCFTVPKINLPVAPLPALSKGMITFGCFQNLSKISDDVLAVWSAILAALPNARMRMQCKQLGELAQVEKMHHRLKLHGISPERTELHGVVSREDYLAAHAEVDFVLDTFPYPGGTTTCEALWMGVPTLTLAGNRLLARQGASLVMASGLSEWIAVSKVEYIAKAIAFANDLPKLATIRANLRQQVLASPVFNASLFASNLEEVLWGMYRQHLGCGSQTSSKEIDPAYTFGKQ